jgi:hypothetical protein
VVPAPAYEPGAARARPRVVCQGDVNQQYPTVSASPSAVADTSAQAAAHRSRRQGRGASGMRRLLVNGSGIVQDITMRASKRPGEQKQALDT